MSLYDQSVFISSIPSGGTAYDKLYVTIYVDDIRVYGREDEPILEFMKLVAGRFQIKDLGEGTFYLGMHVYSSKEGDVHIH